MITDPALRTQSVPFLDLTPIHESVKDDLLAQFADLIDANAFTNGPQVEDFERAFAAYSGTSACVGLSSGLDALRLGLLAAGLEPGDEVVIPANTFVATFEAVSQAGGKPVPADVSLTDYNLDMAAAADAISEHTRFILPVHLYGQLTDMRALLALSEARDIKVLEDACQAHGATRDGVRAGAGGIAGAFSFYPGKNLGAFGDAGALVTDDPDVDATVRSLREHGQQRKYVHELEGYTARLDTIQAIVLLKKLSLLPEWNEQRREAAKFYAEALADVEDLGLPPVPAGSDPVWHLFVVRTSRRDRLVEHLREHGIGVGLHYPEPAHLSRAYEHLGHRSGEFPVAEALAGELLSLPIFPGITEGQLESVVAVTRRFFSSGG